MWGGITKKKGISGKYTRRVYNNILSKEIIHSVRTDRAKNNLEILGYKASNTGCLTLWKLTPTFCDNIPREKADRVIITLTDYNRDYENDKKIIEIVKKNYKEVFFWPQGIYDDEYLHELKENEGITVLSSNIEIYEKLLKSGNIDYVGTRFHGGIYAMRHRVRSIIIVLDERMQSMQYRVANNCILRKNIMHELDIKINSKFKTSVDIDLKEIQRWKDQFV